MQLNRRDFLRLSGGGLCTFLASGLFLPTRGSKEVLTPVKAEVAILYDSSKCVGCRACQVACKRWNKLPQVSTDSEGLYETPRDLSADTWTMIWLSKRSEEDWHFFNYQCMHCTDAACVTVCPTGALFHNELGFVGVDQTKCMGCGYCFQFCPYGVPHLNTMSPLTTKAKVAKCTFCQDRIAAGIGGPFCAETCPVRGALVWGGRPELLEKAKGRVDYLRSQGQAEARIYGENEAGGLHRLSILLDDPQAYGLPETVQRPSLARIWQEIIQPLGTISIGMVALGLALNVLIAGRTVKSEK